MVLKVKWLEFLRERSLKSGRDDLLKGVELELEKMEERENISISKDPD